MAAPIQIQPYLEFLGSEESLTHIVNPQLFSPSGSFNVYMDKMGRVRRVLGYTKANSSAETTDTGGSATRVNHLFGYKSISGGSVTRQLLGVFDDNADEWELKYSTDSGATWTFIADLGNTSDGKLADMAQFQNNLFITNGVMAPRKWDGSSLGTAGGTQSPQPTAVADSAVGPLSGTYKYKLVSVEADGTRHPGSLASSAAQIENTGVDLSWTADSDTDVVGYEVYRTTGTGNLYYFVAYVDGRTTAAYTDSLADQTILEKRALNEHGDAPPSGSYFCETHGDRMWWFRTDTNPARAYFSDLLLPESVGVTSFLNFSDPEEYAAQITGALGNFNKKLVVFTETAVWTVSGTGVVVGNLVDFTKRRSNAGTGSASHRGIVRIPAGAIYRDTQGRAAQTSQSVLAYFTPKKDIRIFDGDSDIIISNPLQDTLGDANAAALHTIHAIHDTQRGQVIWFYPHSSATVPDRAVVWNYRLGTWFRWQTQPFLSSVVVDSATASQVILTGSNSTSTGGYVYNYFTGNTFDGAGIEARWMTGTLYGRLGEDVTGRETALPAAPYTKRFRWADILGPSVSSTTLTVEWFPGHAPDGGTATGSRTFQPSDTTLETSQRRVRLHDSSGNYLHDEGLRLRIGASGSVNNSWGIDALYIGYQNLPGLKRRNQ